MCHLGASDISKIESELRTEGGLRVASDLVASLEHASHTLRGKYLPPPTSACPVCVSHP